MNPPEEQLIRDYVNRVSVAARARLSPEDRRAFVARTRELIESNTRGAGQVGPMGVARFLNGLGDPAALVARERDRLAAEGPDATSAPPAAAGPRRPRPARGAWLDRLRPSGGALSGVPLPRPAPPGRDAASTAGPGSGGPDSAVPGGAVPGGAVPGGAAPRRVLAGDVVTGVVPTGDEPIPGPASESISRPVPGPAPVPVSEDALELAPEPAAEAPGPVPRSDDIPPDPSRLGWPWQGMGGPPAGRTVVNGHRPGRNGPGPADSGAAEADRAPGADEAPGADRGPDPGAAPVIGRWAGGTPVTGDQAAATPSPASSNGRAAANGHGSASGAADRGAGGRWMGGSRERVSNWAGWKPTHTVKPGPSRLRSSLRRPALRRPAMPRPLLARPSLPSGALDAAGAAAWKAARYVGSRARERPLEAAAVVLIGLGGAVYPPVWLLGAALALASRVWDSRDKWLGLAIPVFVVIVGMGADVSLSGKQPTLGGYFREAWIFGGHLCRIVAVLGAVYLAWRSQQPRRQRPAEPWKKQRFN